MKRPGVEEAGCEEAGCEECMRHMDLSVEDHVVDCLERKVKMLRRVHTILSADNHSDGSF